MFKVLYFYLEKPIYVLHTQKLKNNTNIKLFLSMFLINSNKNVHDVKFNE